MVIKMSKIKLIGSLVLNTFIFVSVIVVATRLAINNPASYRMFTTQSNILCGVAAGIMIVFEILILIKKKSELPLWVKTFKMVSVTGVSLTFLVVTFYLGFVAISQGYSYFILFRGNNLFFHFLTPVAGIISFILFEGTTEIKYKYTFFNMIHMICYTIFYTINVCIHLKPDGTVERTYDWYYFVVGGIGTFPFVIIAMIIFTYGIGFGLWIANKSIAKTNLFGARQMD